MDSRSKLVGLWLANKDGKGLSDEEFAEAFVFFYKMHKSDANTMPESIELTADDIVNFPINSFLNDIKQMLCEIIDPDSECDRSAWWKQ